MSIVLNPDHDDYMIVLKMKKLDQYETALSRGDKYNILKEHYKHLKERIQKHISNCGFNSEVSVFNVNTSFNFLFITCSERVRDKILELDFVDDIMKDVGIELIQ